jgi:Protein of unknown function (DUF2946)
LRVLGNYSRASKARSFARAVVLLCLVAHSILVTITHHHGSGQRIPRIATCSVEASRGSDSSKPSGTSSDTCCLSCCLQHNLVAGIQPVSLPPDLSLKPVSPKVFISEPISNAVSLILSNRAPPLG